MIVKNIRLSQGRTAVLRFISIKIKYREYREVENNK